MGFLPVKWGSVLVNGRVGHCSFTSEDADVPKTVKIWDVKGRHHDYNGLAYLLTSSPNITRLVYLREHVIAPRPAIKMMLMRIQKRDNLNSKF